jgi:hypothetical protein
MAAVQAEAPVLALDFDLAQGLVADMEVAPQIETKLCRRLNSR